MANLLGAIQALAAPAPTTAAAPAPGLKPDIHISLPSTATPLEVHAAALGQPSASMPVTRLNGSVGPDGTEVQYLVDSGATALFMDTALAARCKLVPRPSGRTIRLADGTIRDAVGTVTTDCTLTGENGERQSFQAEFCVTELRGHEAILGMPWLHHFNPATNWRTGRFTIERPGHRNGPLELRAEQAPPSVVAEREEREDEARAASTSQPRLKAVVSSHKEWRKMLRKGLLDLHSMELIRLRDADSPAVKGNGRSGAPAGAQGLAAAEALPQHPGLAALLAEFKDVAPEKLGPVDHTAGSPGGIRHKIELVPDAKPHAAPLRRYSPIEDAEIRRVVEEQVALGRMRESTSPWGAMVLLAKKKDGTLRFCVDYRVLNNSTLKNRYALPLADDCFDRAQGARFFSKLDLHSGFWQIMLDGESSQYTAFRTRFGHYEYTVLPMGLCNAPGTFMHVMNSVFRKQLDRFMLVFLDDIFIFSKTEEEHLSHLREVLTVLREQRLFLKPSKCEWMKTEVEFLGHRIGREGLSVDPHKVDAVREWPVPKDVSDVRSFLGLAGYYRRFLENYSQVALPLTELTKDDVAWAWEPRGPQSAAFERLKAMLSSAPVLQLANPALPYVIHCDASGFAIGACLMQDHGEGLQPVSYISAKMKPAETRYAPHEQELLALVYACRQWRHYLHSGLPFTVLSDHQSLRFFTTQPLLSSRQARWKDALAEFDFTIRYIEGPKNVVADALSRRSDHKPTTEELAQRLDGAKSVSREEFLASLVFAPLEQPAEGPRCSGRGEPHALCAAQLRGQRLGPRAAAPAVDPAVLAAQRQANRDANEKMLPPPANQPPPNRKGIISTPSQRCTADAKNGTQCGARTKRGQYCFTHRKNIEGTRIRAATVKAHGQGLFAMRPFRYDEKVAGYGGDLILGEASRDYGSNYTLNLQKRGGGVVDAARTNAGDGRWLNDARGVCTPDGRKVRANCRFVVVRGGNGVPEVRATRTIAAGEEFFVPYGATFWASVNRGSKGAARKAAKSPGGHPAAPVEQLAMAQMTAVAELSSATVIFGHFELIAQARAAAQDDPAYAAALTAPAEGQIARDGLLWENGRLCVPDDLELRTRLLAEMHDAPTSGHFGRDKTIAALQARFQWEGLASQAAAYVAGCDTCQRVKFSKQRKAGLLMPLPVPEDIDSHWTLDHVVGLPRTARGHDAIQGHFSRGGSIKRLAATDKTVDAARAADLFLSHVVRHHGLPASIVSDRGPQFTSKLWEALWRRIGTTLDRSTGYHAETDGLSEREQQTMVIWLRAFCAEFPRDWDLMLPLAELALNCMPQASSGIAPYQLLYGRNPALAMDRALAGEAPEGSVAQLASVPAAQERWDLMARTWKKVRGKLLEGQQRMARNADKHRREVHHLAGDLVLLSTAHLKVNDAQHNAKLAHLFCGPFPIKRVINANAYELDLPAHMQIHAVVNISHLRAYRDGREDFPARPLAPGLSRPPPALLDDNGAPAFEVERVLAQKGRGANVSYLVLWKGYPYTEASWEPRASLDGAADALREFRELHRRRE